MKQILDNIVLIVGLIVSVAGLAATVFAAIKYYFLIKTRFDAQEKRDAERDKKEAEKEKKWEEAIRISSYELKTNGGKSLKDIVLKTYNAVVELRDKEDINFYLDHQPKLEFNSVGLCTKANYKYRDLTGLSENEAIGKGWIKAIHEGDRNRIVDSFEELRDKGYEFSEEYRIVNRDNGKTHWVKGVGIAKMDGDDLKLITSTFEILNSHDTKQFKLSKQA